MSLADLTMLQNPTPDNLRANKGLLQKMGPRGPAVRRAWPWSKLTLVDTMYLKHEMTLACLTCKLTHICCLLSSRKTIWISLRRKQQCDFCDALWKRLHVYIHKDAPNDPKMTSMWVRSEVPSDILPDKTQMPTFVLWVVVFEVQIESKVKMSVSLRCRKLFINWQ